MDILPAYEDSLVVLVSTEQGEISVANLIDRLALLRFQVQWKGPILIIANAPDIQQLQKWDLFRLQQESRYVAQTCLSRPVLIGKLIYTLSILRGYQPGAWRITIDTLKNQDSIQETWSLFRQIESKASNGKQPTNLLRKLIQTLLDEKLILKTLIGHEGLNTIHQSIGIHKENSKGSVMECCLEGNQDEIISSLKKIMERIPMVGVIENARSK